MEKTPDNVVSGRCLLPDYVLSKEREYIHERRAAADVAADAPLVGMALSGGGIRSATFALGVLQSIAGANVLRLVDYMCTVSGGGYMGSCLSSLLTIDAESDAEQWPAKERFNLAGRMPLSGDSPDQMHHLRTHGDFLILRNGFFRRDLLRVVGAFLLASVSSLALFSSLLMCLVSGAFIFSSLLSGRTFWDVVMSTEGQSFSTTSEFHLRSVSSIWFTALGFLVPAAALAIWGWLSDSTKLKSARGLTNEEATERYLLVRFVMFTFAILLSAVLIRYPIAFVGRTMTVDNIPKWVLQHWFPALFFAATLFTTICIAIWDSRSAASWHRASRSTIHSILGICVYGLAMSVGFALVFSFLTRYRPLESWTINRSAVVAGVSFVLTRFFAHERKDSGPLSDLIQRYILAVCMIAIVAVGSLLCAKILLDPNTDRHFGGFLIWFLASGATFLAIGFLIDFDSVSPHFFYRDRLAEAFLCTEARSSSGQELVRDDSGLLLKNLHNRRKDDWTDNPCPYHLVSCAVNLAGSNDLARRDRKSDVFTFSKFFSGSASTEYIETEKYKDGGKDIRLATVLAVSGAAASSGMGFYTSFFRAFATTLFNIRLGVWLPNPSIYRFDDEECQSRFAKVMQKCGKPFRRFWPRYLLRELTAMTDATLPRINLSDGGHTGDNLGLYPLLQRRCPLIIVVDGEKDPKFGFGSLSNAIRMANVDENILVEFNVDDIRPSEGHPTSPYMIGRVKYPAVDKDSESGEKSASTGWIIYLKSAFTGKSEPAGVKTYQAENPEFPHQSTADQFFDDAQFEAYRLLGNYVASRFLHDACAEEHSPGYSKIHDWAKQTWIDQAK